MFKMKYNWFLMILLLINPFIVMSMNSFFSIWINMELNLILFLTFIIMNNLYMYDLSMKYFLVNSMSSSVFFFMLIMNYMNFIEIYMYIMNMMMMVKLGMPPFHFWFIDLMKNLNWICCLVLSTWQKFIPLIILFYIFKEKILILMIIFGSLISIFLTFNSMYLKMILGYSSINHLSWMLVSMIYSLNLWIIYYFSYSILMFSLFNFLKKLNLIYINDMIKINCFNFKKINLMLLFSLGSLPPFFGFLMKWMSIYKFVVFNNFIIILVLIIFSLIFLYYYFRLGFNFLFLNNNLLKYNFNMIMIKKDNLINLMMLMLSIFSLFFLIFYLN